MAAVRQASCPIWHAWKLGSEELTPNGRGHRAALAGDIDAAQQPAAELAAGVGRNGASAVASAVRPVD